MNSNPFDKSGTSSYPVDTPYIGQYDAFKKLQKSLSLDADSRPHTTLVYGDWGAGKTRLGHQIVAEATGESPGWHTKSGSGYERKELISEDESNPVSNTILPLWVHLNECQTEIQSDNAARVLLNQGIKNLIEGEKPIHGDIQDHLDEYGSFHELAKEHRTSTGGPTERLETCLDHILNDTGIDRITVIVDEVEEASSIGKTAPDDEDTEGTPRRTIQALYEGLKEAHNNQGTKYPGNMFADFILLCTDGVDDYIPSGGVERRVDPIRLSRPTIEDATEYVRTLESESEMGVEISEECIAALFFASFNNYGWFTRSMSDIVFYKRQKDRPYYEILRDERGQFSGLLNEQIIDDILSDSESATGSEVVDALYRLRPIEYTEVKHSSDSIDELTEYETPLEGYSPISKLSVINAAPETIKRKLRESGFEGAQDANGEQSARISGEKLDPNRLQDILRVFSTSDGNLALYADDKDLRDLAEFAFGQGQINENAISALVEALRKIESENDIISDSYIGPSLSFLNEWNIRWMKISSIVQWINDDEVWEDMLAAARNVNEEWNERVTKGLAHTRFKHYATGIPSLDSHNAIDATNFVTEIPDDDVVDVVDSDKAVFINHQSKTQLQKDLADLQRVEDSYPIVYIISNDRDKEEDLLAELREDVSRLSPFLNKVSISSTGLEEEFYVQMSFLGEETEGGFDHTMVLSTDEEYLTNHQQQPLERADQSWFENQKEEGWVLQRVVPDGGDPETLAEGVIDWARERSGDWRGEDTIQEWNKANTESDVVPLISIGDSPSQDTFELPRFIPRVLATLESRGPMRVAETSGQFLHDIPNDRLIRSAVQNLLALLDGLSVVTETDAGYKFVDSDHLRTEFVQPAKLELPDDLSEFFEDFYYPPSNRTKVDFRIESDTIQNKQDMLEDIDHEIKELDQTALTQISGDQEDWLDAVEKEYSIVSELKTVWKKGVDGPDIDTIGNEELAELYDKVRDDKEHAQYSIAYRLDLLEQFDDILKEDCGALQRIVKDKRSEVEDEYRSVTHDKKRDFPINVIRTLLNQVDKDLRVTITSDTIHDSLLGSESDLNGTAATIQDHIENQNFAEAFNRLEWYRTVFTQPEGFWASFITAYEGFDTIVTEYTEFKSDWQETIEYFENSAIYSDQIDDVEIPLLDLERNVGDISRLVGDTSDPAEISDIWAKISDSPEEKITPKTEVGLIEAAVSDPVGVLGEQTPAELNNEIKTLRKKLKSVKIHHAIINAVANNELEKKKTDLDTKWEPLAHAAKQLGDLDIKLEKTRYTDKDGFFAKKQAINETIDSIPAEGKRLLTEVGEREQLWEKYQQVYAAGKEGEDLTDSEVAEETLENLSELGLIHYEERFSISIE